MTDQPTAHPDATGGDPLTERVQLAMGNIEHYLECATHYLEGADRGLQQRKEDLGSTTGWSTGVQESIIGLINCYRDTVEESLVHLGRADDHLRDAYRDAMTMARPPHLTPANHDRVVDTLTDTIEVTVAIQKARPHLEDAAAQLRDDPSSGDRITAAREQIGDALPYLRHARSHAAAVAGAPDDHVEGVSSRTPRREPSSTVGGPTLGIAR